MAVAARDVWIEPLGSVDALTAALEGGLSDRPFLFRSEDEMVQAKELALLRGIFLDAEGHLVENGSRIGTSRTVSSPEEQEAAMQALGNSSELLLMEPTGDWQVIPAENLIAAAQHSHGGKLYCVCKTTAQAKVLFDTLDAGVDGVVLQTDDVSEIRGMAAVLDELSAGRSTELITQMNDSASTATVTSVSLTGSGDRVCVDTCSLLGANEGLLVGSSSQRVFLVLSEAAEVEYVPSRPFRVNAGPVHSYVHVPGGKTKYLAELKAGDEVLAVRVDEKTGLVDNVRSVVVGRAKIERRPQILVETEIRQPDGSNASATIIVQNAETVRLWGSNDTIGAISVSRLRPRDELLVVTDTSARHVGMAIQETLIET